ncbi:MAG: tetratricopeptide repeat protein [Paenibacillaceae bacterium]
MDGKQHIQKAYESIIQQDFEQAIEWFEKAVADEPLNALYRYSLSITYARSNKLNKAIEHAAEACRLASQSDNYLLHLNRLKARSLLLQAGQWLYKDHKRLSEAESLLKNAIQLDPLSLEALLMLALAYGIQERYNEAVQILVEASRLDPQHAEVTQLLADYQLLKHKQNYN